MDREKIVIKIGHSVLINENGELNEPLVFSLCNQISEIKKDFDVVIVTSGAISVGKKLCDLNKNEESNLKQAYSSIGQMKLFSTYLKSFETKEIIPAQILTNKKDLSNKVSREDFITCIDTLLDNGILPIINENYTISKAEMESSNDVLASLVATNIKAKYLYLLASIENLEKKKEISKSLEKKGVETLVIDSDILNSLIKTYRKEIEPIKLDWYMYLVKSDRHPLMVWKTNKLEQSDPERFRDNKNNYPIAVPSGKDRLDFISLNNQNFSSNKYCLDVKGLLLKIKNNKIVNILENI